MVSTTHRILVRRRTAPVSERLPGVPRISAITAALSYLLAVLVRRYVWAVDLYKDAIPERSAPPVGIRCQQASVQEAGWLPVRRELDGTVLVIICKRPSADMVEQIEKCLQGAPYRLAAVNPQKSF